jgi:hypothetical protein
MQASQGGYGVEYTQGPQSGYPGNYLNQSAHPGYPHMGATNDIVSQVLFAVHNHITPSLPKCSAYKFFEKSNDILYYSRRSILVATNIDVSRHILFSIHPY